MTFGSRSGVTSESQAGSSGLQSTGFNMLGATPNPLKQRPLLLRLLCLPYPQEAGGTHKFARRGLFRRLILGVAPLPCLLLLHFTPLLAQPRAILADGSGPWQDVQWSFTVSQFRALLSDAGYSVTIVSPVDLPSVIPSQGPLVAVPSLASLPFATFT